MKVTVGHGKQVLILTMMVKQLKKKTWKIYLTIKEQYDKFWERYFYVGRYL